MLLDDERFLNVIDATPLVSVDLVVRNERGQVLLGKRINKPAQGFWFVPGGRIRKNEPVTEAIRRISSSELGTSIEEVELLGVFDHIYPGNFLDREGINTHYVSLGYGCRLSDLADLTVDSQHTELRWWGVPALLNSDEVHGNTKAYFGGHSMKRLELCEDFRHFNSLLWQVPSVGIAIGAGVVLAAGQIGEKPTAWTEIPVRYVQASVLAFGAFLLLAMTMAVYKYRIFQAAFVPRPMPEPPFGQRPRAITFLQGALCLTTGGLAGMAGAQIGSSPPCMLVGMLAGLLLWVLFELRAKRTFREMDRNWRLN